MPLCCVMLFVALCSALFSSVYVCDVIFISIFDVVREKKIKGYILFMILGQSRILYVYLFYMLFTVCFLFFMYIYLEQI